MSESNGEMVFESLAPAEAPVRIEGKPHVIKEASEGAYIEWRDRQFSTAKFGADGKVVGMGRGPLESRSLLVSMCLFERRDNGQDVPVPLATVRAWPSRFINDLFEKVREISGFAAEERKTEEEMERRERERIKNSPAATPDSSA